MPSCAVKWCINRSGLHNKDVGITFHVFPKDLKQRKLWTKAVRLERQQNEWTPSKVTQICSVHFRDDDFYITKKGYTKVKANAIPICTMVCPIIRPIQTIDTTSQTSKSNKENIIHKSESAISRKRHSDETGPATITIVKTESLQEPTTSSAGEGTSSHVQEASGAGDPLKTRCNSPSGLSDIGSSDLEGALDTPLVAHLKNQLKKKEEVCKGHTKTIKHLRRANLRLRERNKTLAQVLTKLKRRIMILERKAAQYESGGEEAKDESGDESMKESAMVQDE